VPLRPQILEAAIIIGQFRTVIKNSGLGEEYIRTSLRTIWLASGAAAVIAIIVILCVAIPLGVLGNELDKTAAEIVEGVSKVIAAICIAQLSLKVPKWLGVLPGMGSSKARGAAELTRKSLLFNVGWNVWRELAEIGIFLIPYFLQPELAVAVPGSGAIGIIIGLAIGGIIYIITKLTTKRLALAIGMATLTGWLSTGLFVGGCHEFEEVWGETDVVFTMPGDSKTGFWSHKIMPMALFKPFGYSHHPTQLIICTFWLWVALLCVLHALKYLQAKRKADKADAAKPDPKELTGEAEVV
jgi:high-affinity iron transporter